MPPQLCSKPLSHQSRKTIEAWTKVMWTREQSSICFLRIGHPNQYGRRPKHFSAQTLKTFLPSKKRKLSRFLNSGTLRRPSGQYHLEHKALHPVTMTLAVSRIADATNIRGRFQLKMGNFITNVSAYCRLAQCSFSCPPILSLPD